MRFKLYILFYCHPLRTTYERTYIYMCKCSGAFKNVKFKYSFYIIILHALTYIPIRSFNSRVDLACIQNTYFLSNLNRRVY